MQNIFFISKYRIFFDGYHLLFIYTDNSQRTNMKEVERGMVNEFILPLTIKNIEK
ncbi:hypothetical protein ENUP19_0364G0024 [Entamoeba nuttalli]|uniref:Uncharacterized protein n=1 Tax=Entamoeba nuttalli TaxID=412467 RepID=A0ABQ0DYH1_9EUKA